MKKKTTAIVCILAVIVCVCCSCGDSSGSGKIYDKAKIIDTHTGSGDVNGCISVIDAKYEECTDDVIADWYTSYVMEKTMTATITLLSILIGKAAFMQMVFQ